MLQNMDASHVPTPQNTLCAIQQHAVTMILILSMQTYILFQMNSSFEYSVP